MTLFSIFEAIRNDKSVPVSGEDGKNVIKIIEAAIKSNGSMMPIVLYICICLDSKD